jgi:hypothetical protein
VRTHIAIALSLAMMAACSSKTAPPSEGSITVAFPSTAAAVATTDVQLYVFDPGDAGPTICPQLLQLERSQQTLPTTIMTTPAISPCDLASGIGTFTIPYGTYAVLAIAQQAGSDFLIGCAIESVEKNSDAVPIDLALVSDTVSVPASTCTALSMYCSGDC